ncbi:aspartate--tRNA ligase [Candidatus Fermentibacteria bacterium]|nr:aspartate--tRNA ligase [Candidatus Fermentibacteria bacterium]
MGTWRTHFIGELRSTHVGQQVRLCGWVNTTREHGDLLFVLVRDRTGVAQVRIQQSRDAGGDSRLWATAVELGLEFCVRVTGTVALRPDDARNPDMPTGDIEVTPVEIEILNDCPPLPFPIHRETEISETTALKYRYLQMRRPSLARVIRLRHELVLCLRNLMSGMGFIEIETPLLTRSTPEGARDFLVPSRVYPGRFFALPQSPQQYKELLMIGGVDRYFQFARCLRDEDARADRQAEHTQLDFEMSFVDREDIIEVLEAIYGGAAERFSSKRLQRIPIPRMSYHEAMHRFGSDKPDLRFELELVDLSPVFTGCSSPSLAKAAAAPDEVVRGFAVPGGGGWSRKELDALVDPATGTGGIAWVALKEGALRSSPLKSALDGDRLDALRRATSAGPDDLIIVAGGLRRKTLESLGRVRVAMGRKLRLIDEDVLAFAFIIDFPMFEWNADEGRLEPVHHMFVLPKTEHIPLLDTAPLEVLTTQVDAVCNGYELCSGSLRIYTPALQKKVMGLIGITDEDAQRKFGHLLTALRFGAPPHGGAAPGLDRLLMVLLGTDRMSDVVAFPKTYSGRDLLMDAPAEVDPAQLADLHLRVEPPREGV